MQGDTTMKFDGWFGKFYTGLESFVSLVLINVVWVIFNLPTLFILISLLIARSKTELIFYGVLLTICLPILLFPATTAMFATIRMLVQGKQPKILREYWRAYKENYGRSFLSGILFSVIWVVFFVDYLFFVTQVHDMFKFVFFAIFLFLFMFMMHYFSNQVHFENSFFSGYKNALILTLKNPIVSIMTTISQVLIIYVSFKLAPILLLFISGSVIAFISFTIFYKVSLKSISTP